jgi:cation transport regulator ChaB
LASVSRSTAMSCLSKETETDKEKPLNIVQIEDILNDCNQLVNFYEYLRANYSDENLVFWLEAEIYRYLPDDQLPQRAQEIYNKFFDENSDFAINIDDPDLTLDVKKRLKSPNRDIFLEAQNVIWGLLKFECFPRFRMSPYFNGHLTRKQKEDLKKDDAISYLDNYLKLRQRTDREKRKEKIVELPVSPKKKSAEENLCPLPEFEDIFKNGDLLLCFREFLYRRIANENLAFWIEVEVYKCLEEKEMKTRAKEIFEKYCKTDSIYAVNIDWNTQSKIRSMLEEPTREIFDDAQKQILKCLKNEWFPEFCQSDVLRAWHEKTLTFEKSNPKRERANTIDYWEQLSDFRKQKQTPNKTVENIPLKSPHRTEGTQSKSKSFDTTDNGGIESQSATVRDAVDTTHSQSEPLNKTAATSSRAKEAKNAVKSPRPSNQNQTHSQNPTQTPADAIDQKAVVNRSAETAEDNTTAVLSDRETNKTLTATAPPKAKTKRKRKKSDATTSKPPTETTDLMAEPTATSQSPPPSGSDSKPLKTESEHDGSLQKEDTRLLERPKESESST